MITVSLLISISFYIGLIYSLFVLSKKVDKEKKPFKIYKEYFPIIAIVFVIKSFVFEPSIIPSSSMEPTLNIGDFLFVTKFDYGIKIPLIPNKINPIFPEKGDLITFTTKKLPGNKVYIKRVVAVEGDIIEYDFDNRKLIINDVPVEKTFIREQEEVITVGGENIRTTATVYEQEINGVTFELKQFYQATLNLEQFTNLTGSERIVVPENQIFVLGDNRDNSLDSRFFGFVDINEVMGKAKIRMLYLENWIKPRFNNLGSLYN